MGIFNKTEEEKRYDDLIKVIRTSNLHYEFTTVLESYVSSIRDKRRNNDFYDLEFLEKVIIEIISCKYENINEFKEGFNKLLSKVRFLLPYGDKTEGYENIKNEIINYHVHIINENLFSEALYSLFDNRRDYIQIMDIIMKDENLSNNFDNIVKFAVELGKELDDQGLLKREIIAYLTQYESILSSEDDYLQERIKEARMRFGIYPGVSEKDIARISRENERAEGTIKLLHDSEKRVIENSTLGVNAVKEATESGIKELSTFANNASMKMRNDLEIAKKDLLEELKKFLAGIEESLKASSDIILNQLLIDAREKLEQIRVSANNLSNTATVELLKIQKETQESLAKLKEYVTSNPELKTSLKIAAESEEVMKAIINLSTHQKEVNATEAGIILPDKEISVPDKEIVVQDKEVVVGTPIIIDNTDRAFLKDFKMTEGILPAFDKRIPYDVRMAKIEKRIKELESDGYIIPDSLRDALPWYLMGQKVLYLYGPTQSGKTTLAKLLAKVVGSELIEGGKITEDHSVTSYNDVNGKFDENALSSAFFYGLTILYDELDNDNPDNLVVLGTYISSLAEKIRTPDMLIEAQFAKRRYIPINVNARIISTGNTSGKGKNKQYSSRQKLDESTSERVAPFYVGYNTKLEEKIFGSLTEWHDFFEYFRSQCVTYAVESDMGEIEGNVTTSDASVIVQILEENNMTIGNLMRTLFVQTKETEYLNHLIERISEKYKIKDNMENINNKPLRNLSRHDIASSFVHEANIAMNRGRALIRA